MGICSHQRPVGVFFEPVLPALYDSRRMGRGGIFGPGEGKEGKAGAGVPGCEGINNSVHGRAGGEQVVQDKEMGRWRLQGGGVAGVDGIESFQLFLTTGFTEGLDGRGGSKLFQQAGEISNMESPAQPAGQDIEGDGYIGNVGLVVMKGSHQDGPGGDVDSGQRFQGAVDPSVEVGLAAQLKFQEAVGKGIPSGGPGQVAAEEVMRIKFAVTG